MNVLRRVGSDATQLPVIRGAVVGALWTLHEADGDQVRTDLLAFADPIRLGDFLNGLFALGREVVQRQADLLKCLDSVLMNFVEEDFLSALPSLRMAFTYFTPREKSHLVETLWQSLGLRPQATLAALEVSAEEAAQAMAFEMRLFGALNKYGIRKTENGIVES